MWIGATTFRFICAKVAFDMVINCFTQIRITGNVRIKQTKSTSNGFYYYCQSRSHLLLYRRGKQVSKRTRPNNWIEGNSMRWIWLNDARFASIFFFFSFYIYFIFISVVMLKRDVSKGFCTLFSCRLYHLPMAICR